MCNNIGEKLITTCSGKKKCTNNPKKYNNFILFCSVFNAVALLNSFGINSNLC